MARQRIRNAMRAGCQTETGFPVSDYYLNLILIRLKSSLSQLVFYLLKFNTLPVGEAVLFSFFGSKETSSDSIRDSVWQIRFENFRAASPFNSLPPFLFKRIFIKNFALKTLNLKSCLSPKHRNRSHLFPNYTHQTRLSTQGRKLSAFRREIIVMMPMLNYLRIFLSRRIVST